ncbi:hypothetical protein [Vulcanisaeta sp. EB80]|uniref:hypothetical protein n=1 Tax=Vulcanisaeta sp. EB80 TaxID=1650660 RepID=UPI0011815718|nr:hypothetical protein [Vulcanisaeta sp. EB80]
MIPRTYYKRSSTVGNQLLDTSTAMQTATPHPTIILTTRFIRHYEHGHKTATLIMRTILMKSNYKHNKHTTQQHAPRKIIGKLPKITLT